ncbi:hypothetical protein ACOMHN_028453 [Nucella lapillus]
MDNGATQTSSNADDRAVERGPAEGTPRYWLRKQKHNPSSERQPRGKRARKSDNGATQTSSNADDRAVERGPAEGTPRYWLQKQKHNPSSERQPRGKRARKSDGSGNESKMKGTDPMVLDDVVVDTILGFLDDDTLLTSRLVCQRWNKEITQRNGLWRRRCEQLGALKPNKTFPPNTDFFGVHGNLRKVLHQMFSGESWQVNDNCDGSQCTIHKGLAKYSQRQYQANWASNIVADVKCQQPFGNKMALCTTKGELVFLDEETKEVEWRTEKNATDIIKSFNDVIFTITLLGNIEVYTLDGKCEVTDTDGKLQDVEAVRTHPTAPFLLVWLANNKVFLVNDQMQLFPLHLPAPKMPEQQDGHESTDAECILNLALGDLSASDDQLALSIERKSSVCFVSLTTSGDILDHVFLKGDCFTTWPFPLEPGQGRYRFICVSEGHAVAHSIRFSSRGIAVEELWRKALPARLAAFPHEMVAVGQKFLLAYENTTLRVYRMDDGTLAAVIPNFLNSGLMMCVALAKGSVDHLVQKIHFMQEGINMASGTERCIQTLYTINYDWLEGLSPSNTKPDFPVAVTFSEEYPNGRCLRWSEGLWESISLPAEQKRQGGSSNPPVDPVQGLSGSSDPPVDPVQGLRAGRFQ